MIEVRILSRGIVTALSISIVVIIAFLLVQLPQRPFVKFILDEASKHALVQEVVGQDIEIGWTMWYRIRGGSKRALHMVELPLVGSKGKGTLKAAAVLEGEVFQLISLIFLTPTKKYTLLCNRKSGCRNGSEPVERRERHRWSIM